MANDSTSIADKIFFSMACLYFFVVGTIICIIGIFSNSLIIGATIRKASTLRFKTNWLIFALALADLACNFTSIQIFIYFWIGMTHWTRLQCFYGAFMQIISATYDGYLIFAVALDRLLMVKYPVWYYNSNAKRYLTKMIAPGIGLVFLLLLSAFLSASDTERLILCIIPQAFGGPSGVVFALSNLTLCLLVTALNIWTFVLSRHQVDPSNATWRMTATKMQHLNRSIVVVSIVFVSTFFLAIVVVNLVNVIKPEPLTTAYIFYENGFFAYINFSVNGIIYGWRSGDYRKEYKKFLGINVATIAPTSAVVHKQNSW